MSVGTDAPGLVTRLTQGTLVRINRATFELEPWLAEKWDSSGDGRTLTVHLRPSTTWSDGVPLTSADVLFSLLSAPLAAGGQPVRAAAPDAQTIVFTLAAPFGPGIRILDTLVIRPEHAPSRADVGTGPFVLHESVPGQRFVLDRNARYWRTTPDGTALPYLDRIVLDVVTDPNVERMRLEAGMIDMTNAALRAEDEMPMRMLEEEGKLRVIELGVGPAPDAFWFCLKPDAKQADPRFAFVQQAQFRQAISHAVDREQFAEAVYLGEAVPVWGPVTPGNSAWFWPDIPRYRPDLMRARELLAGIGLEDRNKNGVVEDGHGTEARFTVLTERGVPWYEKGTAVLKEDLARVGIAIDITPLDAATLMSRVQTCDYDAVYLRHQPADLDPAGAMDFWLSSGAAHVWNPSQRTPTTEWERRIDTLMLEQAATLDPERRRQQFILVQRIMAENLPVLYLTAPRMYLAHTPRIQGVVPSVLDPPVLWNADSLSVQQP